MLFSGLRLTGCRPATRHFLDLVEMLSYSDQEFLCGWGILGDLKTVTTFIGISGVLGFVGHILHKTLLQTPYCKLKALNLCLSVAE